MSVEVRSLEQFKAAIKSQESEIIVLDDGLVRQLKAVSYIKKLGPISAGLVVAAIPLIIGTGGMATIGLAAVAPGAAWATSAIVALVIGIGGVIAISLFTDWDYVELPFGIKMERRSKQ